MENIKQEIEELILDYIIMSKTKITRPNDILEELTYDAIEDLKERMWELIKYEIDYDAIFDEIEKNRSYDDPESDLDEEEPQTDDESDVE